MDKINECFEKKLLLRVQKEPDLALKETRQTEFFLKEAEELLEIDKKVMCAISLYNAYFHCIRSLLFRDGIKEKSHYCTARYLETEYTDKEIINRKFLDAFETIMSIRHTAQYSTEPIKIEEDLANLINLCEELLFKVKELLK